MGCYPEVRVEKEGFLAWDTSLQRTPNVDFWHHVKRVPSVTEPQDPVSNNFS